MVQKYVNSFGKFFGNRKSKICEEFVQDMLAKFKMLGADMRIKLHYLYNHLDKFPNNPGDFNEDKDEIFYQDMKLIEEMYQGRCDRHIMADYFLGHLT